MIPSGDDADPDYANSTILLIVYETEKRVCGRIFPKEDITWAYTLTIPLRWAELGLVEFKETPQTFFAGWSKFLLLFYSPREIPKLEVNSARLLFRKHCNPGQWFKSIWSSWIRDWKFRLRNRMIPWRKGRGWEEGQDQRTPFVSRFAFLCFYNFTVRLV